MYGYFKSNVLPPVLPQASNKATTEDGSDYGEIANFPDTNDRYHTMNQVSISKRKGERQKERETERERESLFLAFRFSSALRMSHVS